jgi:flotillin
MESSQFISIAIFLGVILFMLILIFIKTNVVICKPNEIVILSGKKRKSKDGTVLGYRVLRGGRGFKWPFIESVSRLFLNTRTIQIHLGKVLASGMIPLEVESRANIKLAGKEDEGMENAVERFIGKGEDVIDKTAQQVLEGAIRGVIAAMSPAEANEKRFDLVQQVLKNARPDLKNLGIVLDSFQILSLSDKHGHLEAIGRKRNAEVQKEAKIAEAIAEAESRTVAAEQMKLGREAEISSELTIVSKEKDLEVKRANMTAEINKSEAKAIVAREIADAEERIEHEKLRIQLTENKTKADILIPAEAKKNAMAMESEGYAARIFENGQATAKAIELMSKEWKNGDNENLFLIRMLPELFEKATKVIADNLNVEKLTIIDGGNGEGMSNYVNNLANSTTALFEQLKNTTGIDIAKMAKDKKDLGLPPKA